MLGEGNKTRPKSRNGGLPTGLLTGLRTGLLPAFILASLGGGCSSWTAYRPDPDHAHVVRSVSPPTAAPESLLVVTYNVQWGEDLEVAEADLRRKPAVAGADVILLQEMDLGGVESLARDLGCNLVYHAAAVHPHHGRLFGNAVLSPWPIVAYELIVLPHPHPLSGQRRIAVLADLEVAGRPLRTVSVHMATPITPLEDRVDQAAAVIEAVAGTSGPVIVGGDLNTATDHGRVLILREFRKARLLPPAPPTTPTIRKRIWLRPDLELALDHILTRGLVAGSSGVIREAEASDHLPVWARFAWPPP